MAKHPEKLEGAAFADLFCLGTRLVRRPSWLQRLVVGDNEMPDGWVRSVTHAQSIPWIHFDGDPSGPRLPFPRLYRTAGQLTVSTNELAALQRTNPGSRQALAVRFDEAVVVGALAEGQQFPQQREDGELLVAQARISRGALDLALGVFTPVEKLFVPATSTLELGTISLRNI